MYKGTWRFDPRLPAQERERVCVAMRGGGKANAKQRETRSNFSRSSGDRIPVRITEVVLVLRCGLVLVTLSAKPLSDAVLDIGTTYWKTRSEMTRTKDTIPRIEAGADHVHVSPSLFLRPSS